MNLVRDIFLLQINCIVQYMLREPGAFRLTLVIAVLFAAGMGVACGGFARLWNTRYRISAFHYLLCILSAAIAFCFTLCAPSLKYTKEAALVSIGVWRVAISLDSTWAAKTFKDAYDSVQATHTENFTGFPPPGSPVARIPVNHSESRLAMAATYANGAVSHFQHNLPFLSLAVWPHAKLPAAVVRADVDGWDFRRSDYPVGRAIDITATQIKAQLEPQAPRVVWLMRLLVVILFLIAESIPFGIIGRAAYRDIRITT